MLLLIDAYNLLKFMVKSSRVSPQERTDFINTLALYSLYKKRPVLLVFDGGDYHRAELFEYRGITLVYAGYASTADNYIKNYIEKYNGTKNMILISSDNELCDYANMFKITCLEVQLFALALKEGSRNKSSFVQNISGVKKSENYQSDPELDTLMIETSKNSSKYVKDESQEEVSPTLLGKKLSKSEKRIQKLLKKL